MSYAVGSLVKARGREWVVLPGTGEDFILLQPLGGSEDEVAGIIPELERVESAVFDLPDPNRPGDYRSGRLLRDAMRLGFRSSAGPFRSFGRLGCDPRPYQLVPLLMALKLDPVRLLIADDVGIGKTIEACLIARELLDRGEAQRLAVICPPHLAEQWQNELLYKFHIDATLVLSGTVASLERQCALGQSLFELYPHVIISMDFIKSDRRRAEFLRSCPELVIVDEAHTCSDSGEGGRGRQQRHAVLRGLAQNPDRHILLVTATPHSGKEEAFRSLLTILNKNFAKLPQDLTGPDKEPYRRELSKYFVQRMRANIKDYLQTDTFFPEREDAEENYSLTPEYKTLFARVLAYAREAVSDPGQNRHHQRVRWWSVLALLRSLASSPAAAAATLRNRAAVADTETAAEADEIGRRTVLDLDLEDMSEEMDIVPGSDAGEKDDQEQQNRRRLLEMAGQAERLYGSKDAKLQKAVQLTATLLEDGFHPIIFCRFIPTAEYLAEYLRKRLPRGVEVTAVTGTLPPAEREERINLLAQSARRVLVATDCLSEGINLQQHFNAVFHYDLSWNPTRHEQREGRVDRYGQTSPVVRALTYYGTNNQIDGIVLDVLLRKHKRIRSTLGISVPVPADTNAVVESIMEGLVLRRDDARQGYRQQQLSFDFALPIKEELHTIWDEVSQLEKRSMNMFAQRAIKVEEVARELQAVQDAIGTGVELASFTRDALQAYGAVGLDRNGSIQFNIEEIPQALRETMGLGDQRRLKISFDQQVGKDVIHLTRTHPMVEGLSTHLMNEALDPLLEGPARRCGVIKTGRVAVRTTVLLVRFRFHIITRTVERSWPLLAEDCLLLAFEGAPQNARWLDSLEAAALLEAEAEANIYPQQATQFLQVAVDGYRDLLPHLEESARLQGELLLQSHRRVRTFSRQKGVSFTVEPKLPPDILGIYVYLPV